MNLMSIFKNNETIPTRYCYYGVKNGQNISVPLNWSEAPQKTRSLALLMYDIHPIANNWVHWMVTNIPVNIREFPEGISTKLEKPIIEHFNSYGEIGYGGPQPPKGSGPHQYIFTIYALNTILNLPLQTDLSTFLDTVNQHTLDKGVLIGIYER